MIVYFAMPDEGAKEINGFLGMQYRKLKLSEITRETFRNGFQRFKAVLVVPNKTEACSALNVPEDEPGIIQGWTPADYARKIKKSRQAVNRMIHSGAIKSQKIGKLWVVTE